MSRDSKPDEPNDTARIALFNYILLAAALLAASLVFFPVIGADWFCDDYDYVLNDPRAGHLELFLPWNWSQRAPEISNPNEESVFLPGQTASVIADRYIWRLSFALERALFGQHAAVAHGINLALHLACILALYWALSQLLALLRPEEPEDSPWRLLPGLASLLFAVCPWAFEPVCYVSARNASLGTLFTLSGLALWAAALRKESAVLKRAGCMTASLLCALAAFGCKENFVTALAGYLLAAWPVLWSRSTPRQVLAGGIALLALLLVPALGIQFSGRAGGLWQQAGVRGWSYFFDIQNPLVLSTLADQLPAFRLGLEANHPGWPFAACLLALACNLVLPLASLWFGRRWPPLLGLAWFYLHLLPTNSFLPRPDFLAARNVYLPAAGIAVLLAAAFVWAWLRFGRGTCSGTLLSRVRATAGQRAVFACGVMLLACWSVTSRTWAQKFTDPEQVWAQSALVAPDHAAVRLNLACAILSRKKPGDPRKTLDEAEAEVREGLRAEDSPTMALHSERPRRVKRALALRLLGQIACQKDELRAAGAFFRQSFEQVPSVPVWTGWASSALDGSDPEQLQAAVAEGLRRWPEAWWPRAARALGAADCAPGRGGDLGAAVSAADAVQRELWPLQTHAIYEWIRTHPAEAQPKLRELCARLKRLGLSAEALARLREAVR